VKQLLYNLLSSIFYKVRYSKRKNPFLDFSNLHFPMNFAKDNLNKGTVLITPIRVTPASNLFEGLFGVFFRLRGYKVKYFLCNQELNYCENIANLSRKCATCSLCLREQKVYTTTFKTDNVYLSSYVSRIDIQKIKNVVKKCSFDKDEDYIFEGVNLKDCIESGVMRYTQKSDVILSEDIDLLRKCATTSFLLAKFIIEFSSKEKIYKLISSHGIYSSWGAIIDTARVLGIDSIVWGRGYIGQGNVLFGHNRAIQDDLRNERSDVFDDIELTEDNLQIVKNYFFKKEDLKSKVDYINYYVGISLDDFDIEGFNKNLSKYNTIFGMFTNIPWDGQVFNKTEAFPTTIVYVRYTIEWFKQNPDCLLVIRAHPAEVSRDDSKGVTFEELLYNEYPQLPDNVIFLGPKNPITSYMLSTKIDYAIMYGSSMSIELAIRKIPVIHTGYLFTSNKGIVFDIETETDYYDKLIKAKNHSLKFTEEMYKNAMKYGYYWIMKRHIKDTSTELSNLNYVSFNFSNEEEFMKDEFLNFVFDKITSGKRIVKA
jgi:hypothetical protein